MPINRPFTFKGGRRRPDPAHKARSIRFEKILKQLPNIPGSVDYFPFVSSYPMDGNADFGDCVSASIAHELQLVTKVLADAEYDPTLDEVYAFYATQNPGFNPQDANTPDNGMDMQTAFEYLLHNGWTGGNAPKLVAFAQVPIDATMLRAAIDIFGAVQLGLMVQQANEDEFNQGLPWDYVAGSPELGGHCIPGGGYDASQIKVVTWATETALLNSFVDSGLLEEAWVLIWPWHLGTKAFQTGIDITALAAAYQEITGNPLPIPAPPPQPTPPPVPTPPPPTPQPTPTPSGCFSLATWRAVWKAISNLIFGIPHHG